ncbi:MAG: type III pantothenate kinase [Planctomycetota bacterium]|nr:type III pantothenate kinase [Planctomycetaceae bacterium]MDQ3332119.1 type III pantothenate kinase [Planctomycetota bacterium]
MPAPLVLAIDVGNSRVKAGALTESRTARALPDCVASTAIPVSHSHPAKALSDWLETHELRPRKGLIGGVNPAVIAAVLEGWIGRHCPLTHIARPSHALLVNRTTQPDRVGPDRLFDAVAANRLRQNGASALIIDSGTATTVNLVDAEGAFAGGAILAGFELVASALHERTALLPKVDVADLMPPPHPLGRDTEAAIRSGLHWGLVGAVKELVARLSALAVERDSQSPVMVLTGGASPLLLPHLPEAQLWPHLTLQGVVLSAPSP